VFCEGPGGGRGVEGMNGRVKGLQGRKIVGRGKNVRGIRRQGGYQPTQIGGVDEVGVDQVTMRIVWDWWVR